MRTIRLRLSMAAALMAAGTLAAHAQTANTNSKAVNTNSKTADRELAKPRAKPAPAKTAPAPAASSGMTVFIDPATGRLALRYSVTDTSINGDFVGIDTVLLTDQVPEPGTAGLALAALSTLAFSLRVRRR